MVTGWPTGRPPLNDWDRLFGIGLSRVWKGWRGALVFVQPDTVVRWQRDRFRRFWARLSRVDGRRAGRPALAQEVRRLILQVAKANPKWRTPRFHGELKMLGTVVSEGTVPVCCGPYRPSVGVSLSGLRIAMYTDNGCFRLLPRFEGLWRRRN